MRAAGAKKFRQKYNTIVCLSELNSLKIYFDDEKKKRSPSYLYLMDFSDCWLLLTRGGGVENTRFYADVIYDSSRYTRLQHRTCKTSQEHFASLLVSKKVPATWRDFDFFFLKKSPILKIQVGFFSTYFFFCQNKANYLFLNYLWLKFQHICGAFFFTKYPRFWKLKFEYFPIKKVFAKPL